MMKKIFLLLLIAVISSQNMMAKSSCQAENLRCEYTVNPLGIDILSPHLSWTMTSNLRGDFQKAYRIIVSSSPDLLKKDKGDIWDSGKVESDASLHIVYQGKALKAATKYYWKVRVWNKNDKPSKWSKPAFWSMGLFSEQDWENASWIAFKEGDVWKKEWAEHKDRELKNNVFKQESWPWLTGKDSSVFVLYETANPKYDPSPLFRKDFSVEKKVRSANLYICGLGYYEAFINGKKVGDHVLDPAWTNYEQRSMYVTYDVTDRVGKGDNTIGVMLGRGQYNPLCNDIWNLFKSAWVDQPKLIALLDIEYTDGTKKKIVTDKTWKTAGGPVVYDDTRHGELYDARLEQKGWSSSSFDDSAWKNATIVSWDAELKAQMIPAIRCFDGIKPVKTYQRENGITIYDIGENIAGWATVKLKGPKGSKVLVEYCETPSDKELLPNLTPWRFDYKQDDKHYATFFDKGVNIRQQNGYILKGEGEETVECLFSYKAFRFIRVTAEEGVTVAQVEGVPVHTDVEIKGDFTCSNPIINKTQENSVKSLLSNFHSIATDCPHREKQGWTADNYMSSQAALYNFNMANFYSKWLVDLAGTQSENGDLCTVAPSTGYDMAQSTAWPKAIVLIPWDLYHFYGDTRAMEEHYEAMKAFAKSSFIREVTGKPEIINDVLGDWVAPGMEWKDNSKNRTTAPPEGLILYGTSSHYLVVKKIAEMAKLLGKEVEAKEYEWWAQRIADNFNKEFFDPQANIYNGNIPTGYRQGANIVPLQYGLVPKEKQQVVLDNLLQDIHQQGNRLSTGFLGTWTMMNYLPSLYPELAYELATHTNYPGWGFMIKQGAISMWESWDGFDSQNHTPFCLISAYFYKHLAGIQYDLNQPAFKHTIINPSFENDLDYVQAYHDSMYGRIESNWKRDGNSITMNIVIPANTTATIYIPGDPNMIKESGKPVNQKKEIEFVGMKDGKAMYNVGSGSYQFNI